MCVQPMTNGFKGQTFLLQAGEGASIEVVPCGGYSYDKATATALQGSTDGRRVYPMVSCIRTYDSIQNALFEADKISNPSTYWSEGGEELRLWNFCLSQMSGQSSRSFSRVAVIFTACKVEICGNFAIQMQRQLMKTFGVFMGKITKPLPTQFEQNRYFETVWRKNRLLPLWKIDFCVEDIDGLFPNKPHARWNAAYSGSGAFSQGMTVSL